VSGASGNNCGQKILNNRIYSNGARGIESISGQYFGITIDGNIVASNTTDGIHINNARTDSLGQATLITNNVIYDNGGDGIEIANWNTANGSNVIRGNIITENGGFGLSFSNASASANGVAAYGVYADYNAFKDNTSGNRNDVNAGANDITLTADPFVDAAGGDFNINNTTGGGADLRAATVVLP
jgi:hypothetical protein